MIGYLRGIIIGVYSDYVLLDVNGVGYKVFLTMPVLSQVMAVEGEVSFYVCTIVREDSITLYGFINEEDQGIFEKLLLVSGLGVKSAMGALSAFSSGEIVSAVLSEDIAVLSQIPNVGKKTAQRMILELKDKFSNINISATSMTISKDAVVISEAVEALVILGYSKNDARKAVDSVCSKLDDINTSIVITRSLAILSKGI